MIAPALRDPRRTCLLVLCGLGLTAGLISCSSLDEREKKEAAREREDARMEKYELKDRLAVRNEGYSNWQDRRRMRKEAREERYQEWWHRIMH